ARFLPRPGRFGWSGSIGSTSKLRRGGAVPGESSSIPFMVIGPTPVRTERKKGMPQKCLRLSRRRGASESEFANSPLSRQGEAVAEVAVIARKADAGGVAEPEHLG